MEKENLKPISVGDFQVIRILRTLLLFAVFGFLSSCGGGHSSDGATSAQTSASQISVSVDPAPPQAAQAITQILSATDGTTPGKAIGIPQPSTDGQSLLVGADKNGDAILLAFAASNVVLSVDTTAIALVRIAMGDRTTGTTPDDLATAIRATSRYAKLTQDIQTQIASGGTLQNTPGLADDVWSVATATYQALSPSATSARQIVAAEVTPNALPYYPFNNGATDKFWLSAITGNSAVMASNRTRLAWHVTSSAGTDTDIDPLAISTIQVLTGYYGGTEVTKPVAGGAPKFQVLVEQNPDMRRRNFVTVINRLIFTTLDLAFLGSDSQKINCAQAVASYAFDDKFSALMNDQSADGALAYVKNFYTGRADFIDFLTRTGPTCDIGKDLVDDAVTVFFNNVSTLAKIVLLTPSLEATGEGVYQLAAHWNDSYTINLCEQSGMAVICQPDTDFFVGSAVITQCNPPPGSYGGCNYLSYNENVNDGAGIAFRLSGGDLNIRLDQPYGCIGTTASVSSNVGDSFTYTLSSAAPYQEVPTSTTTFTVTSATDTTLSGTFSLSFTLSLGTGTASGTWSATRQSVPFPKCLLPTIASGQPSGGPTPQFFCPSVADNWGCHYIPINGGARSTDWPS